MDEEVKLDCLARWMLDHWATRKERRASLERMHSNLKRDRGRAAADAFIEDLKRRIRREWERRKGEAA